MPDSTLHISSLLIRANPADLDRVQAEILKLPNSEIPLCDDSGKIIVTLETSSESEIVDSLTTVQLIDGVVSAAMIYHQADSADAADQPLEPLK
jgi:nitrate reductase NapD